jgi:ribosomal protein L6P/L9E
VVVSKTSESRQARAFHGLTRSLINNMIVGVKNGYEKRLEIVGVGYLAAVQGDVAATAGRLRQRSPQENPPGTGGEMPRPDARRRPRLR